MLVLEAGNVDVSKEVGDNVASASTLVAAGKGEAVLCSQETAQKLARVPQEDQWTPEAQVDDSSARGYDSLALPGACQATAGTISSQNLRPVCAPLAQQVLPTTSVDGGGPSGQLVQAGPVGASLPAMSLVTDAALGVRDSPTPCSFLPISCLSPYARKQWRIKCRVVSKTNIRKFTNAKGEGQFFKVQLSDASGMTSGTFFGQAADSFFEKIHVGKVYVFSKGSVKAGNSRFDSSEYVINFDKCSEIQPVGEDHTIPGITFDFKVLADIEQSIPGTLVDIRAVVYSAGETMTFIARSTNKELTKKVVGLWDSSGAGAGCFVDLALWGESAQQSGFDVGAVVLLKSARVGEYQGVKNLSSPSSVEINPDHPEAFMLLAKFEALNSCGNIVQPSPRFRSTAAASGPKTIKAMQEEDMNLGPPPVYGQVIQPGCPRSVHWHHLVVRVTHIPADRMPC